jgi:hypothetical protein
MCCSQIEVNLLPKVLGALCIDDANGVAVAFAAAGDLYYCLCLLCAFMPERMILVLVFTSDFDSNLFHLRIRLGPQGLYCTRPTSVPNTSMNAVVNRKSFIHSAFPNEHIYLTLSARRVETLMQTAPAIQVS